MKFSQIVISYVNENNLKISEASDILGVCRQMMSRYIKGKSTPSYDDAIEMIQKMGKGVLILSSSMNDLDRLDDVIYGSRNINQVFPKKKNTKLEYKGACNRIMGLYFPKKPGFHRDHIIPVSFCREIGLSPDQTSHPKNMRYITPDRNEKKGNFITVSGYKHLEVMCKIWGIDIPSDKYIKDYNKKAKKFK